MNMKERIDEAVNSRVWAVVGASNDRSKFGNRIYRNMHSAGYRVYPVNPNEEQVEGAPAFATLADLPETPDVVDVVVPSWVGRKIAQEAADAGIRFFWLQPGAESNELVEYAESLGLEVIHNACAMVERRHWDE
jgi:predicted CoA-binding protein